MLVERVGVLTASELEQLTALLGAGRFVDGGATAGAAARRVKRNLQLDSKGPEIEPARRIVNAALARNEDFRGFALPLRMLPPLFSRYEPGMTYGDHTDNAIMGQDPQIRTDIAVTLFLSPPDDYEGGELTIGVDGRPRSIKLPAGAAVIYPAATLHRVEPVTRGQRLAAVTWVQSVVRDAAKREILTDLWTAIRGFRATAPEAPEGLLLAKTRANLMRMWAEL